MISGRRLPVKIIRQNLKLLPWLLFVILGGSGCATSALWTSPGLECWKEPDQNPNLRLYDGAPCADFLVVYDQYSERSDTTHRVAYWMNENERRLNNRRAPEFVSPKLAVPLASIPTFNSVSERGNSPPPVYALVATNGQSFTLYSDTLGVSSHDLPVYNDGKGKMEKAVLTPVAVTADLTIVGGVIGYWYLAELCYSGASFSAK